MALLLPALVGCAAAPRPRSPRRAHAEPGSGAPEPTVEVEADAKGGFCGRAVFWMTHDQRPPTSEELAFRGAPAELAPRVAARRGS
jgi:hypothetical protein